MIFSLISPKNDNYMNRIQPFWQCQFKTAEGTVWRMLSAKTALQAKDAAFQTGFRLGIEPIYDSIRRATSTEIRDFKKMIKQRAMNRVTEARLHTIIRESVEDFISQDSQPSVKGVIFDFDYTLFNTDAVQEVRSIAKHTKGTPKQKDAAWQQAYAHVGDCVIYPGIKELVTFLSQKGIPCAVVSMCKPEFVSRTLAAFGLPNMAVYGASLPYMPKNKGMRKFVASIGINPEECLSIGDRASDGSESSKAGVKFLGCSWGNGHDNDNIANGLKSPLDVIKYIGG